MSRPRATGSRSSWSANAQRLGYRIGEVPITFREREHGRSKISRSIVFEALLKVGSWGLQDRFTKDGRRSAATRGPGAETGS